jgi:hypothetical protein
MTDQDTEDSADEAQLQDPRRTTDTYEVTVLRSFEMDMGYQQAEVLMRQTDTETPEAALGEMLGQRERDSVKPEHKLTEVSVNVDETSDD